jgi:hypothetical protein
MFLAGLFRLDAPIGIQFTEQEARLAICSVVRIRYTLAIALKLG